MSIHQLDATGVLQHLASGELSSTEVVAALVARREALDGRVNAFVLTRQEALDEARVADEQRARGELRGPLHGLPVTIKDNIDVAGADSTLGLASRRGRPAAEDAVLVAELVRQGAIVLGKTNVPQLLLAQETENAVFGVTNNPWNLERVPGGSSGGEAAAVACGMSLVGIGTDIGGSIRVPAHFCGVVGFKPTLDRWSNRGSQTAFRGQEIVRAQIGALARSVRDVQTLWRAVEPAELGRHDPRVAPAVAEDPSGVDLRGLTIGFFDDDPFLRPVPSLRRAVAQARQVLESAGARLLEHTPVASEEVIFLWLAAISADGGRTMDRALDGEPVSAQLKPSRTLLRLPELLRGAASRLVQRLGEERVSKLLQSLGEKTVAEVWELTERRTRLRHDEFDRWRRGGLDAVICPPHVVPALSHRESGDFALSLGAQFRWTLLDFPAGVVPVTTVMSSEVGAYASRSDRIERKVAAIDEASVGLPVGVQVVARPFQEHVLLAVMNAIEAGVRGEAGYPVTPVEP